MDSEALNDWWRLKKLDKIDVPLKHSHVLSMLDASSFPLVDLGCGTGKFLQCVEACWPDSELLGVEGSEYAVSNKLCQSSIICSDIRQWSPSRLVRSAVLIDVIEHITSPESLLEHVGGFADNIIVACPNFNHFSARISVLVGRVPFQNRPQRGGHIYWCNYNSLLNLFAVLRFSVVSERHIYTKQNWKIARKIGSFAPSLFAHEFVFHLRRSD